MKCHFSLRLFPIPTQTNDHSHQLFNLTKFLINEGEFVSVEIVILEIKLNSKARLEADEGGERDERDWGNVEGKRENTMQAGKQGWDAKRSR